MRPKQRWLIIGSLLLATLAAGYLIDDETVPENGKRQSSASATKTDASSRAGEDRRSGTRQKTADAALTPLNFPEPPVLEETPGEKLINPFRNKSWYLAPPAPPPKKPVAPPVPFKYLGKVSEGGETRVFLSYQNRNLIAKVGDLLSGIYTVDAIAGDQMVLIYQPLNEKQVFSIGTDK